MKCLICGVALGIHAKRDHCDNLECIEKWLPHFIERNVVPRDGHDLWTGDLTSSGTPTCFYFAPDASGQPRKRRLSRRVVDVLYCQAHGTTPSTTPYANTCGVDLCVSVEHNTPDVHVRGTGAGLPKKGHGPLYCMVKLPAQPLLDVVDRMPYSTLSKESHKALNRCRQTGVIPVWRADEICIDYLKCHPAEIYGDLFYEAA